MASTKQAVIKALVSANLLSSFDKDAINSFVAFVDSNGGGSDAVVSVIKAVRTGGCGIPGQPLGPDQHVLNPTTSCARSTWLTDVTSEDDDAY